MDTDAATPADTPDAPAEETISDNEVRDLGLEPDPDEEQEGDPDGR